MDRTRQVWTGPASCGQDPPGVSRTCQVWTGPASYGQDPPGVSSQGGWQHTQPRSTSLKAVSSAAFEHVRSPFLTKNVVCKLLPVIHYYTHCDLSTYYNHYVH